MSGYMLCQTKKAEVPFFIENISTNIYTLEELCYYLYHNLCLIDQTLINENLCDWLSNELGLTELAGKLRPNVGKFASAEDILYPIFKEINYLTYEELRTLNGELANAEYEHSDIFNVEMPKAVTGVPAEILNPETMWIANGKTKEDYVAAANRLATMFAENFAKKYPNMPKNIAEAGPKAI